MNLQSQIQTLQGGFLQHILHSKHRQRRKSIKQNQHLYTQYIKWKQSELTIIKGVYFYTSTLDNINKSHIRYSFHQLHKFTHLNPPKIKYFQKTIEHLSMRKKKSAINTMIHHVNCQKKLNGLTHILERRWKSIGWSALKQSISQNQIPILSVSALENEIRVEQEEHERIKQQLYDKMNSIVKVGPDEGSWIGDRCQSPVDKGLTQEYMERYQELKMMADEVREQCECMASLEKEPILQQIIQILRPY